MIRLTLARNVAFNIVNKKTTSGLMKALCNMYKKPSASNKVYLMRRLFNLKMTEGFFVTNHINEFNITMQLSSVDINFDDKLHNVKYIPGLKHNLISIGQLDSIGYKTIFGNSSWRIVNGAMFVAKVKDSVKWESTIKDEFDSLMKNRTWELSLLSDGKKALQNKWIYRIKEEADSNKRYKVISMEKLRLCSASVGLHVIERRRCRIRDEDEDC
ncbi:Retrovirus-related Pol polyprotein from transposon TNT 1-94 [Apostasia shenzhenica]|uniref:Retrovirus-related Pol polyprotein from transposon TNT 1-94 n=1 Tax=Apostasia shenzhenica TaxID=1088818 RepID=A0A2H9ZVE5_9ASPA|nr:Retrovirus-related Pol polyprotein from transposon TNT 1-94 [Apostasia shenzhenica]